MISPIQDIIADLRAGKIVVLVDEEDRENEGDLVMAAAFVTPEAINFMAKYGRGLVCAAQVAQGSGGSEKSSALRLFFPGPEPLQR